MRKTIAFGLLLLTAAAAAVTGDEPRKADAKDYAEFSKLIHQIVVKQLPKVIEDNSGWGQTVPIPDKLAFPKLKRTTIKVGDKYEFPNGLWRKVKAWMTDPAKDLQIRVTDFKSTDSKTFRLVVEADVFVHTDIEGQVWKNGLNPLGGFTGQADVALGLVVTCDVATTLDTKEFPPKLKIDPKVTDLKTNLKDLNVKQLALKKVPIALEAETAKELGNRFKDILQDAMRAAEPTIKAKANEAIAKSLQDGKGTISAAELMKVLSPPSKDGK